VTYHMDNPGIENMFDRTRGVSRHELICFGREILYDNDALSLGEL
jgi:hypothetical protein